MAREGRVTGQWLMDGADEQPSVTLTGSAQEFSAAAGPWLAAHALGANVVATVLAAVLSGERSYDDQSWAVVRDGSGEVVGAAMHTAPYPPYVPDMPAAAAAALAEAWHAAGRRPPGVNGGLGAGEAFAQRWCELTGAGVEVTLREGLHLLGDLRPPSGVPGRLRDPAAGDEALALAWFSAFIDEAMHGEPMLEDENGMRRRLSAGVLLLWEDGGVPVSMAGWRPPAVGVGRVGPVYTPPEHRRRGYAAAVTAAATQAVLDAGARECTLFTDLANPTSNGVYARLGYRRVGEAAQRRFT